MSLDIQLATRIRALRKSAGYSLEQLAERSGVSRSMISLIERAETSATAASLNKLADALGVSLASLFAGIAPEGSASPLTRYQAQVVWQDPETGYSRRQLSPTGISVPVTLTEVIFPAGQRIVFEQAQQTKIVHQQLWLLAGEMEITIDDQKWCLVAGDCLAMTLGTQIIFANPICTPARYLLALTTTSTHMGRTS